MSGIKYPGVEHGVRHHARSSIKGTFWHTFLRFSVLLTITRDPCKLGRVETLTEGRIFLVEFYKRNRINFDCTEAII